MGKMTKMCLAVLAWYIFQMGYPSEARICPPKGDKGVIEGVGNNGGSAGCNVDINADTRKPIDKPLTPQQSAQDMAKARQKVQTEEEGQARLKAKEEESKKAEEEAKRRAEEEAIGIQTAMEKAKKKAEEEEQARLKGEEEEQARLKAEEEEQKRAEEEEQARLKAEEEERKKAEDEELAKREADIKAQREKAEKLAEELRALSKPQQTEDSDPTPGQITAGRNIADRFEGRERDRSGYRQGREVADASRPVPPQQTATGVIPSSESSSTSTSPTRGGTGSTSPSTGRTGKRAPSTSGTSPTPPSTGGTGTTTPKPPSPSTPAQPAAQPGKPSTVRFQDTYSGKFTITVDFLYNEAKSSRKTSIQDGSSAYDVVEILMNVTPSAQEAYANVSVAGSKIRGWNFYIRDNLWDRGPQSRSQIANTKNIPIKFGYYYVVEIYYTETIQSTKGTQEADRTSPTIFKLSKIK